MENQALEHLLQMSVQIFTFGALDVLQDGPEAIELLVQLLLGDLGLSSSG